MNDGKAAGLFPAPPGTRHASGAGRAGPILDTLEKKTAGPAAASIPRNTTNGIILYVHRPTEGRDRDRRPAPTRVVVRYDELRLKRSRDPARRSPSSCDTLPEKTASGSVAGSRLMCQTQGNVNRYPMVAMYKLTEMPQ